MFFIFAFIGWTWEVSLHLINDGQFVNRGVLFGPWLPIYGAVGVLILIFLNRVRQWPAVEFVATVILCGIVEYSTSVYLEWAHDGQKWWDYSGYFLNINGRVCAEGLLVFGLGGVAIVYLAAPMLDNLIEKVSRKVLIPVCLILLILYGSDNLYSFKHPNTGDGITGYEAQTGIDGMWRCTGERGLIVTAIFLAPAAEGMDGLRIALVADTHFGYSVGTYHAERLVEAINEADVDVVCIAGDIFDNEFDAIAEPEKLREMLGKSKSTYGVYACWGNHDLNEPILAGFTFGKPEHPGDYEDARMAELLEEAGITLLNDQSVLVDGKFYLVGRRDASRSEKAEGGRALPEELTAGMDQTKPIIFMDHQPEELQVVADAGADLDLCGHTHDGQMFPGNFLMALIWANSCGYLRKDDMHSIVTSDVGV